MDIETFTKKFTRGLKMGTIAFSCVLAIGTVIYTFFSMIAYIAELYGMLPAYCVVLFIVCVIVGVLDSFYLTRD